MHMTAQEKAQEKAQERARTALLDALTGGTPSLDAPARTELVMMVLHPMKLGDPLLWEERYSVGLAALRVRGFSVAELTVLLTQARRSRFGPAAVVLGLLHAGHPLEVILDFVRSVTASAYRPDMHLAEVLVGSGVRPLQELGIVLCSQGGQVAAGYRTQAVLLVRSLSPAAFEVACTLIQDAVALDGVVAWESLATLAQASDQLTQ